MKTEPMPRKMTDQRLHEIAESANLRNVVLTQVPSRFDERVKECNDQIGELVDTVLALRFELNHLKASMDNHPDKARLDWLERERERLTQDAIADTIADDIRDSKPGKVRFAIDATASYYEPDQATWVERT